MRSSEIGRRSNEFNIMRSFKMDSTSQFQLRPKRELRAENLYSARQMWSPFSGRSKSRKGGFKTLATHLETIEVLSADEPKENSKSAVDCSNKQSYAQSFPAKSDNAINIENIGNFFSRDGTQIKAEDGEPRGKIEKVFRGSKVGGNRAGYVETLMSNKL